MSIESEQDGTQVGSARREPPHSFPKEGRAQILEHSSDRLVLLIPAGSSRLSRGWGLGLIAMNLSFVGGMAYWTSQAIGKAQNAFIIAVLVMFAIFLAVFSAVLLVYWLRFRFTETWILVEPSRIAVKDTLFRRSVLKTFEVDPDTVATFVPNLMANDDSKQKDFNVCVRCGRKKIAFGTLLSLGEKQWILDEINRILSGGNPQLWSVVLREGKFEFVPDEVAPDLAGDSIRIDRTDSDGLVFEADAKPRTALRRAGWLLELVLSGSATVWLLGNVFMRWWPAGAGLLGIFLLSIFPLFFAGALCWGSAGILFVTTKIAIDRQRLTRIRTPALFGRRKSIPTSSVTEVVVRTHQDPRRLREGKLNWRLPNRNATCLVRTASESLELSLMHESQDLLQIAGLVRFQLKRFEQ